MADFKFHFMHLSPMEQSNSRIDVPAIVLKITGTDVRDSPQISEVLYRWAEKFQPSFAAARILDARNAQDDLLPEMQVRFTNMEEARGFLRYYSACRRLMDIPDMPDPEEKNGMTDSLQAAASALANHTKELEAAKQRRRSPVVVGTEGEAQS